MTFSNLDNTVSTNDNFHQEAGDELYKNDVQSQKTASLLADLKYLYINEQSFFNHEMLKKHMNEIYNENVFFKDPLLEIKGLNHLYQHLLNSYKGVQSCDFEYSDEVVNNDTAFVKWDMHLKHKKLGKGKLIVVRGVTHIICEDKIIRHEDSFDLGSMLYQNIPFIGPQIKVLKKYMAKQAVKLSS